MYWYNGGNDIDINSDDNTNGIINNNNYHYDDTRQANDSINHYTIAATLDSYNTENLNIIE